MAAPATELQGVVSIDLAKQLPPPTRPTDAAAAIAEKAKALQVIDDESLAQAESLILNSGRLIKNIEDFWEEDKTLAHRLHKSITTKIAALTAPFRSVRETLEPRRTVYLRKKEEDIRKEQQRIAQEAEQRRQAEVRAAMEEQRKAAAAAEELTRQGDLKRAMAQTKAAQELAQAKIAEAQMIADAPPVVAEATVKTAGITNARPWVGEIVSGFDVLRAVVDNKIALMVEHVDGDVRYLLEGKPLITIHRSAVTFQAKRFRQEDIKLPGCKGVEDFGMRVSRTARAPEMEAVKQDADLW